MRQQRIGNITIENANLAFLNFKGAETRYNAEGSRNFCVILEDPKVVNEMIQDGWNIKTLKPGEGEEVGQPYIQVAVKFDPYPPKMVLVTHRGHNVIPEDLCNIFDEIDIAEADVTIRPYEWNVREDHGIKAYLKTLYVVQREDPLDLKWAKIADEQQRALEAGPTVTVIEGDWR